MHKQAFTLIELLIVVAIIGILAAIAVPNFMNARIRAKIAHSKSELRTYMDIQQTYLMDVGDLPGHYDGKEEHCPYVNLGYVSGPLTDPFMEGRDDLEHFYNHEGMYHSTHLRDPLGINQANPVLFEEWKRKGSGYVIFGEGPSLTPTWDFYEASNGLRSYGRIMAPSIRGKSEPGSNMPSRDCS
ncbi:MAG: prepilin-type N-terminal cleavage/methylation domain-containing protein [bacterium]